VPLINDAQATEAALTAAASVFDPAAVQGNREPLTVSEDFARFLDHAPGCFAFIGNGESSAPLHNPGYDFNDAALPNGARFFAAIVRQRLATA
jgi:metal-dependent amidase/aminoacylase/carboxypeptidase family protein